MLPLLHSNINEYMYKAGKVPSVILVADNTVLSFGFTKLIESQHFLAWFVVCFPTVIITLLHGFDPYMTFYLHHERSMIIGACTHHNAMKPSIELCHL